MAETVAVCGGHLLWMRPILRRLDLEIAWRAQTRMEASSRLFKAGHIPDVLVVWSGWGLEFVNECVGVYHSVGKTPRVIVVARRRYTLEEEIEFQKTRIQGMVSLSPSMDSHDRKLLAECLVAVRKGEEFFPRQ